MRRRLGKLEQAWYLKGLWGSANTVRLVAVSGALPLSVLQRAFRQLFHRHPLLRARVSSKGKWLECRAPEDCDTEVKVYDPYTTDGQTLLDQGLNNAIDASCDTLIELHFIPASKNKATHELILVVHHLISDGTCFTELINELMKNCQAIIEHTANKEIEQTYACPQPFENYCRKAFRQKRLQYVGKRLIASLKEECLARPKSIKALGNSLPQETKLLTRILDRESSQALVEASRQADTTVQGALTAAMIESIAQLPADKRPDGTIRYLAFVNMRERAAQIIDRTAFTCAVSYTSHLVNPGHPLPFWQRARDERQDLVDKLDTYQTESHLYLNVPILKLMRLRGRSDLATFVITNLGRLPFDKQFGSLSIHHIHSGVALHSIGSAISLSCLSFDGRIHLGFSYLTDCFLEAEAHQFANHFIHILDQNQSPTVPCGGRPYLNNKESDYGQ